MHSKYVALTKKKGCQREGELGQLDNHLNYNPPEEKQLEGCQFSKIKCLHCPKLLLRIYIRGHQSDYCQKRPFSCKYCEDYDSYYEDVTTNHWPVCGYYLMLCPQKCGQKLKRRHLERHVRRNCPLTVVDCDFQHVGCEVRLPRKDMPAHLVESVVCHLSLQAAKFKDVVGNVERLEEEKLEIKQKMVGLQEENNDLRIQVENLTQHLKLCTLICPVEFTLTDFEKHKKGNTEWRSLPFYNDLKGYKLCLGVYPNGYGFLKDHEISIYLVLMKGEFDDQLKWPPEGYCLLKLLNQDQEGHKAMSLVIPSTEGNRVPEEEKYESGLFVSFSHDNLQHGYLKNDCLKFRIDLIKLIG